MWSWYSIVYESQYIGVDLRDYTYGEVHSDKMRDHHEQCSMSVAELDRRLSLGNYFEW